MPANRAALEALASPARQELLSALGEGPVTVRELGLRLGRTRQALYYHLGLLETVGLVRTTGWRGAGRDRERVVGLVTGELVMAARRISPAEVAAAARATGAMLRLTSREVIAAIGASAVNCVGAARELMAMRGKARLNARELHRLNALLDHIYRLLARAKGRQRGHRLYAVTIVLTPARQAALLTPGGLQKPKRQRAP